MKILLHLASLLAALLLTLSACGESKHDADSQSTDSVFTPRIDSTKFITEINGHPVSLITLANDSMEVSITNYGARIVSIFTPDSSGKMRDVILGYDSISDYRSDKLRIGAIEGRIAGAVWHKGQRFGSDSATIAENHSAWADSVFDIKELTDTTLTLQLASLAGESGLPGNVGIDVKFTLRNRSLIIDYTAVTTAETPLDVAHRLQFNLNGTDAAENNRLSSAKKHYLYTSSQQHLYTDSLKQPNGHMLMNIWTPFDFRSPRPLTYLMNSDADEMGWFGGIDTYFVFSTLGDPKAGEMTLSSNESGIKLTINTNQNGVHLYTMNSLKDTTGKNGITFSRHSALEILPHNYTDMLNHKGWGKLGIYSPGKPLSYRTVYTFSNIR